MSINYDRWRLEQDLARDQKRWEEKQKRWEEKFEKERSMKSDKHFFGDYVAVTATVASVLVLAYILFAKTLGNDSRESPVVQDNAVTVVIPVQDNRGEQYYIQCVSFMVDGRRAPVSCDWDTRLTEEDVQKMKAVKVTGKKN